MSVRNNNLEEGPPEPLFDKELDGDGVHRKGEDEHAGGNGPVMVLDPPRPDAAAVHLCTRPGLRLAPQSMIMCYRHDRISVMLMLRGIFAANRVMKYTVAPSDQNGL